MFGRMARKVAVWAVLALGAGQGVWGELFFYPSISPDANGVYTIPAGSYTVNGAADAGQRIVVTSGIVDLEVTSGGLTVAASSANSPFTILSGTVNLKLTGDATFTAPAGNSAGINISGSLRITGDGSLTATGGANTSGAGGVGIAGGTVVLEPGFKGTVIATGGTGSTTGGAGIGSAVTFSNFSNPEDFNKDHLIGTLTAAGGGGGARAISGSLTLPMVYEYTVGSAAAQTFPRAAAFANSTSVSSVTIKRSTVQQIIIGDQAGTMTEGIAGETAAFPCTLWNIPTGSNRPITVENLPTGVTAPTTMTVSADHRGTLTLTGSASTVAVEAASLTLKIGVVSKDFDLKITEKMPPTAENFDTSGTSGKVYTGAAQSVTVTPKAPATASRTGAVTVHYQKVDGLGSTAGYNASDVVSSLVDAGFYRIFISTAGGTHYVRIPESAPIPLGNFEIKPRPLKGATFAVAGGTYVYDGVSAHAPTVAMQTVKLTVGSASLELTHDRDYTHAYTDNINAGTATVTLTGKGNFTDTVIRGFTIDRREITLNLLGSVVPNKIYDGSTAVDTSKMTVGFTGVIAGQTLQRGADYRINSAVYGTGAGVGAKTVTATIALVADGPVSKNYRLASGSFSKGEAEITRATPTADNFQFTFPPEDNPHRFTGTPQGIGSVTVKTGAANSGMGSPVSVLYNGEADKPVDVGNYSVSVSVPEGTNFSAAVIPIGAYVIDEALKPDIASVTPSDTTARQGTEAAFRVAAVSPNKGQLSYQWYTGAGAAVSGATSAQFKPSTNAMGTFTYFVRVYNRVAVGSASQLDSADGGPVTLTVIEPPKPISNALVIVRGDYVYTGAPLTLPEDSITVTDIEGEPLEEGRHYELSYANNVNVGTATVTVTGIDEYSGAQTLPFKIVRRTLTVDEFVLKSEAVYNAGPQPAELKPVVGDRTGIGAATVLYDNSNTVPVDAGEYSVILIRVAEGQNYTALELEEPLELGLYTITKKTPDTSDVVFEIPEGHYATGEPQGIGAVTLKGTGFGDVTVLYDGSEDLPVDIGTYAVIVDIEGGANYTAGLVPLGSYIILDSADVSVAAPAREIFGGGIDEAAAIAPVVPLTARFTAGPNPANRAGAINFYYTGMNARGTLTVYDAAGNVVNKIVLDDAFAHTGNNGRPRQIGSWDMRDSRGRAVANGTYLIKGGIKTPNGKTEKVSLVVGVR